MGEEREKRVHEREEGEGLEGKKDKKMPWLTDRRYLLNNLVSPWQHSFLDSV